MSVERILRKQAYHVHSRLITFLRHNHQFCLFGRFGCFEHCVIPMPLFTGTLCIYACRRYHTPAVYKCHGKSFGLSADITHTETEIILCPTFYTHTVPSRIIQRIGCKNGIMGIVLAQRAVCHNPYITSRRAPRRSGSPLTTIGRSVFEVTILHHFSIQSAVGSIAYILKENTNELVADGFLTFTVYSHSGLHTLSAQSLEQPSVVSKFFTIACALRGKFGKIVYQRISPVLPNIPHISSKSVVSNLYRVRHDICIGIFSRSSSHIRCEMAERCVGRCLAHTAVLGLEKHGIAPTAVMTYHRSETRSADQATAKHGE